MKQAQSELGMMLAFGLAMNLSSISAQTTMQSPPFEIAAPDAQDNFAGVIQRLAVEIQSGSGVPAVAVVVVNSDGNIGTGAAGFRKAGNSAAIQATDAFHLGSVTKPITATLIAKLVEQRKLSWKSTPAQIFPEWQGRLVPAFKTITLAQILAHQAGLAPFTDDKEISALPPFTGNALEQRRQFTKFLLTQKPAFKPGAQYSYSNAGYTIAAAMAERVTGRSWEALMKKYIFIPLKLNSAMFGWPGRHTEAAPWGHKRDGDRWAPQDPNGKYQPGPLLAPGGDLSMNAKDLGQFLRSHLLGLLGRNGLLHEATVKKLHHQYSSLHEEALGWDLDDSISIKTGSAETFFCIAVVAPAKGLAFAVLLNANDQKTALTAAGKVLKTFGSDKAKAVSSTYRLDAP